jgi:hypothetical protein
VTDDDDPVGYGKPPKHTRFKKGQSGCPDGGWPKRRAGQAEQRAKAKAEEESIGAIVQAWFAKRRPARVNGKEVEANRIELLLAVLEEDALVKRDRQAQKLLLDLARKTGLLAPPPPPKQGGGVLVVYAPLRAEEWERQTEGELLTKDPLEGIPGHDPQAMKALPPRRRGPPDDPL